MMATKRKSASWTRCTRRRMGYMLPVWPANPACGRVGRCLLLICTKFRHRSRSGLSVKSVHKPSSFATLLNTSLSKVPQRAVGQIIESDRVQEL